MGLEPVSPLQTNAPVGRERCGVPSGVEPTPPGSPCFANLCAVNPAGDLQTFLQVLHVLPGAWDPASAAGACADGGGAGGAVPASTRVVGAGAR
jgi:hypothetical protein